MKNLSLDDFALFVQIANTKSLSGSARLRNIAPSLVSRALTRIEAECKLCLAHRTTHGLSLTHEGEIFLETAKQILYQNDQLKEQLGSVNNEICATVVISISQLLAEYVLIPKLTQLQNFHPKLTIDLLIEDRLVSMSREGIDIAVRAGVAPADNVIARSLGQHGRATYASPDYLRNHTAPMSLDDLHQHKLIGNTATSTHNDWHFSLHGKVVTHRFESQLRVNNSAAVVSMVLAGTGIARINDMVGQAMVAQGRLVEVLTAYKDTTQHTIHAIILSERHRAPKIRACMEFLTDCFTDFK